MKSLWHPCVFTEDADTDRQSWYNAVIAESSISRLNLVFPENDSPLVYLIVAIKFYDSSDNNALLITLARKEISTGESSKHVTLYASKKFLKSYPMFNFSDTYLMKLVNPYPLEKIIIGTTNEDTYKLARSDKWTVDLMLRVCEEKVLCRQGDGFPSQNSTISTKPDHHTHPDLVILQCQPVLQGILSVQTQIIIVKLEENYLPQLSFNRQSHKLQFDDSTKFNLLDYWNLLQFCACFVLPYTLRKNQSPNPVLAIMASAFRILHQSLQPTFNVQILPVCPFRNIDCNLIDPINAIFVHSNVAKKLRINNLSWVQVNVVHKSNGRNEECDGDGEKMAIKSRWVQVYYIPSDNLQLEKFGDLSENLVYVNPTLWFNLNHHPSSLVQPDAKLCVMKSSNIVKSIEPPDASEVTVALIQSPHYFGIRSFDDLLHKYFSTTRYVQTGDVLCVGSTGDPEVETTASDVWKVKKGMVFFKVTKIIGSNVDSIGYFASKKVTSLYQISTSFSFVPNTVDVYSGFEDGRLLWNNPLPPGLLNYVRLVQDTITPYLKFKSLSKQILPSILLTGSRGCGKWTTVKAVARMTNVHLHEIDCYDLLAETSGSTEAKLKMALTMAGKFVPCLLVMKNVHVLGKSKDGAHEDCRVMQVFHDTASTFTNSVDSFPLVLIGITTDEDLLTADFASIFLHKIHINTPSDVDRFVMLEALLVNSSIGVDVSISKLADETKGFVLGDLCALISNATLIAHKRLLKLIGRSIYLSPNDDEDLLLAGIFLSKSDFTEALSVLQAAYSDAIGAPKVPNVEWEDVGGLEDVKRAILDTVQLPLQHPELISAGLKRSGILLFGPPGTGKTLIAKAVATECHLHFLSVKGPELLNMYVGQSEENVREVFKRARNAAPCVVFFDELDSLAPNRGRSGDSGGVMDRVVSQLLAELDGLDKSATVYVIGATNRPDLIDPALLRPGRFDKLLFVGVSENPESKLKILEALTRKFNLSDDVELEKIASICPTTATGADLYALCSDAVMNAISKRVLQMADGATQDSPLVITNEDLTNAAQHLIPSVSSLELARYKQIKVTAMRKN